MGADSSVAEQRVTDEQLTDWAAGRPVNLYDWPSIARVLVAEVRASRAREAELRQRDFALHAEIVHQTDERDALQQRIDKSLTVIKGMHAYGGLNEGGKDELTATLTVTRETGGPDTSAPRRV